MSFRKSIQSLRALTEAPLPPLMDPTVLYPEKNRDYRGQEVKGYSAAPIFDKIDKVSEKEKKSYGLERLGQGSSRVAIRLKVSANEFTKEGKKILQDYGIKPSGQIKTIIKLALNEQGVAQNTSEIRAWEDTKSRLFVPVLDHSAIEKRKRSVEVNGEPVPPQYSNWIQTIEVKPFSNSDFDPWYAAIQKFFGVPGLEMWQTFRRTVGQKGFAEKIKEWDKSYNLTRDQLDNLNELLDASKKGEMAMGDLYQPANWGAIGDRLFVIDYGFDVASKLTYGNAPLGMDISIDNDGTLSIDFKGSKEVVDIAKDKLRPS